MNAPDGLAERFEAHRGQLRAVAYRMLGSLSDADDAVQEAWLRLSRLSSSDAGAIESLEAWLRTAVSRLCLDMLRTRTSRREEPLDWHAPAAAAQDGDPEQEALLLDSVGRAMLVVLDALAPAERVAFVLHDLFAVPFDEIAPVLGRTPATAKKLASRARLRVRGAPAVPRAELARQRSVVEAFLAAALVLGPRARFAEPALVNGMVGAVIAPHGRLQLVLAVTVTSGRVAGYDVIADPARLARLELAVLDGGNSGHPG
jgi:RNA polymerase sigma-70 factor (ECF subfamily)